MANNITLEQVIVWVQQLQDQEKLDFQSIKKLEENIVKLNVEIEKAKNLNNLINRKIEYKYNQLEKDFIKQYETMKTNILLDIEKMKSSVLSDIEVIKNLMNTSIQENNQKINTLINEVNSKIETIQSQFNSIKEKFVIIENTFSDMVVEENKRIESEKQRVSNETLRNELYETFKSEALPLVEKIKKFDVDVNVDFKGKEHLNAHERLLSDYNNLLQLIYQSSLLPYENSSITATKSYEGLTSDMRIKGRTLQNLVGNMRAEGSGISIVDNKITFSGNTGMITYDRNLIMKDNTMYTLIVEIEKNNNSDSIRLLRLESFGVQYYTNIQKGFIVKPFTTSSNNANKWDSNERANIFIPTITSEIVIKNYMILEGDHTNTPLSELAFGEGIYSVGEKENNLIKTKSCGKNLFKLNSDYGHYGATSKVDGNSLVVTTTNNLPYTYAKTGKVILKKGTYTIKYSADIMSNTGFVVVSIRDFKNFSVSYTGDVTSNNPKTFTISEDKEVSILFYSSGGNPQIGESVKYYDIQIEENATNTPFEDYRENTQQFQLTEPLRSLPNGVCDELFKNELIRRVGKVVIDGSDPSIQPHSIGDNSKCRWRIYTDIKVKNVNHSTITCVCNDYQCISANDSWGGVKEGISQNNDNNCIYLYVKKYELKSESVQNTALLRAELKQNPITIYYELETPIITKLDKTVQLGTYNGTTHIMSENYLQSKIETKVPSNTQLLLAETMLENKSLKNNINLMSMSTLESEIDSDYRLTKLELGL